MLSGFEAYKHYVALKLHFTDPDYDFFKYNGKISSSIGSFRNRKDAYTFEKIAGRYGKGLIIPFLVANFVKNPQFWVGDSESDEVFLSWKGRVDSLTHLLKEDCNNINNFMKKNELVFGQLYSIEDGKFPALFRFHLSEMISPETAMLLMVGFKLFDKWDENPVCQQAMYQLESLKLRKYSGFFDVQGLIKSNQATIAKMFHTA